MTILCKDLKLEDWLLFKELRLEMLQLVPEAFGSSREREESYCEREWRDLVGAFHPIVLKADEKIAATAGYLHPYNGVGSQAKIVSMYVRPPFRSRGLGRRVLQEIVTRIGKNTEAEEVLLDVFAENRPAVELYLSQGFAVRQTASPGDVRGEIQMSMPLAQGRST